MKVSEKDLREILSHCIYDPVDYPLAVEKLNEKLLRIMGQEREEKLWALVESWPHRRKTVDGQNSLVECMPSCHRCALAAVLGDG
jgi:hypothetical protein